MESKKTKSAKLTQAHRLEIGLFGIVDTYVSAPSPSAGWKAAWRYAGHASRGDIRRELVCKILDLAKMYGVGESWPKTEVSAAAQRGMERALKELGIPHP